MRRLFMLWLILTALCAAVIVIARREPVPDALQAFGFDWCAGEPCLRGVTVGMSLDHVLAKLPNASLAYTGLRAPFDKVWFRYGSYEGLTDYEISLSSDQTVTSIGTLARALKIRIGSIVARYGSPCRVTVYRGSLREITITLHYPRFGVSVALNYGDPFPPAAPVDGVAIYDSSPYCSGDEGGTTWQGFKPSESYINSIMRAVYGNPPD